MQFIIRIFFLFLITINNYCQNVCQINRNCVNLCENFSSDSKRSSVESPNCRLTDFDLKDKNIYYTTGCSN